MLYTSILRLDNLTVCFEAKTDHINHSNSPRLHTSKSGSLEASFILVVNCTGTACRR
jgi:hypothetical protein